ncbi:MAG: lysophospholipid acyltransferase family protein [Victivallaceae bacterium]|nr:lysophospholipid acyltransferase family protein [Victivallaceae bacterium]
MAHREQSKIILYLEYIPVFLLYKFVRLLPLHAAYWLSAVLFRIFFALDRKHRVRTIQHLMHAKVAPDRRRAVAMAKECFRQFSMLLVEIFKGDQMTRPDSVRIVGNLELAAKCGAFGEERRVYKNVIIVTAHYGNWEIAGGFWVRCAHTPMLSVMRSFTNPYVGELILRNRRAPGHELVDKVGGFRAAYRALKQGKSLALLVDQHANHTEGVETTFFGQPCRTHASAALLHLKTGVPLIPEVTRRAGNNFNFEFVVGDPIEYEPTGDQDKDVKAVTQIITSRLEKLIAEKPEQWLWTHRRWLNINRKSR